MKRRRLRLLAVLSGVVMFVISLILREAMQWWVLPIWVAIGTIGLALDRDPD